MASILLVDDDATFRQTLSRALQAEGYVVREACDGKQALCMVGGRLPDLLLTDLVMPDGDGVELVAAMKSRHPGMRILAVSGRGKMAGLDLLELVSMLGADAVLAKPFSLDQLLGEVARLIGLQGPPTPA